VIPTFVKLPFFVAAMIFAGLANDFAFFVLYKMRSIGHRVGVWRTTRDWALYREYWRIAPANNWSRAPIWIAIGSFLVAGVLVFAAMWHRWSRPSSVWRGVERLRTGR